MTKTSNQAEITVKDVLAVDFLPFLLSIVVMVPLLYGIGWLIGSTDPRQGIPSYYIQVLFMENPLVGLIMVAAACFMAVGQKPQARFWSTMGMATFIALIDASNFLWHIDVSGYLSIFAGILLMISGWRLWDYYEVRKIYTMPEPYLTKAALATYIALGILAIILLIPYGN
jgi:membrane protein